MVLGRLDRGPIRITAEPIIIDSLTSAAVICAGVMNNQQIFVFLWAAVLPSMALAWLSVRVMRSVAPRIGLVDRPGARKVHTTPTPLGGGLGIWFGVVGSFALLFVIVHGADTNAFVAAKLPGWVTPHLSGLRLQFPRLWLLLGCGTVLTLLGLWDDRHGLNWKMRILVELAVAVVAVTWGQVRLTAFIGIPQLEWLLSVLWIVALINSFNMLDNMDALSGGIAAIAAAMLAAALLLHPDPTTQKPQLFVSGLLLVLVGSLLGFLWHNRPPAKIFMGDCGSYFVGFTIAVATLLSTYSSYTSNTHAVLTPLCVMAVPLYDLVTVLWIRLREGRSPFQGDKSHFSHRLVELGLTKEQAVLTIYLTTATCGFGALLLHRVDTVGAFLILLMILCLLLLVAILESGARRKMKS